MTAALATTLDEVPFFLEGPLGDMLGLTTLPTTDRSGLGVVLAPGSSYLASSGGRRLFTRLARDLAAHGHQTLRFTYHGVADSAGEPIRLFRLDRPMDRDTVAAATWMAGQVLQVVLVGQCYGARTALAAAAQLPDLRGLVLLSPPWRDVYAVSDLTETPLTQQLRRTSPRKLVAALGNPARRKAYARFGWELSKAIGRHSRRRVAGGPVDPAPWLSRSTLAQLEQVAANGTRIFILYGDRDAKYPEFCTARPGVLGQALDAAGAEVIVLEASSVHTLAARAVQEAVIPIVRDWVDRLA